MGYGQEPTRFAGEGAGTPDGAPPTWSRTPPVPLPPCTASPAAAAPPAAAPTPDAVTLTICGGMPSHLPLHNDMNMNLENQK